MNNNSKEKKTIFLCVTPLQVRICLKIIELEKIENFDFIFFTYHITNSIYFYYKKLEAIAKNSIILEIKNNRELIKKSFFLKNPFLQKNHYNKIYLASIDNLFFKKIIKINNKAIINTFDDGTANIFKESSYYKNEYFSLSKRQKFYSKILNLPSKHEIIKKSERHFTIFNNFENIISKQKLKTIEIFEKKEKAKNEKNISFFIGQPFHEYLNKEKIKTLINYLEKIEIDYYVMHPRETEPILKNIKILKNDKEIAEVTIIEKSGEYKPLIISAFSTVLFNINESLADKIYLSLLDNDEEIERLKLITQTNSKIIKIK